MSAEDAKKNHLVAIDRETELKNEEKKEGKEKKKIEALPDVR